MQGNKKKVLICDYVGYKRWSEKKLSERFHILIKVTSKKIRPINKREINSFLIMFAFVEVNIFFIRSFSKCQKNYFRRINITAPKV